MSVLPPNPIRYAVEPRDVPLQKAARRLHLTQVEFQAKLEDLLRRGFPPPDPTTGMFDLKKIDQWMDNRPSAESQRDRIQRILEGKLYGTPAQQSPPVPAPAAPSMTILEWIDRGLRKPGKTRVGLGRAMGVCGPVITRLMQGKRKIIADEVPVIARYLDEPVPSSFRITPPVKPPRK